MNRKLKLCVLILSAVLNVALLLLVRGDQPDAEARPVLPPLAAQPRVFGLSIERAYLESADPAIWLDDPLVLADRLRAEGLSNGVIRAVIAAVESHKHWSNPQDLAARDRPRVRWNPGAERPDDMDSRQRLAEKIDRAVEEAGVASGSYQSVKDRARLEGIASGKHAAIRNLEKSYQEMREKAERKEGNTSVLERPVSDLLAAEFERDLAGLLSPAEVKEYLRKNSGAAQMAHKILEGLEVDAGTYNSLVDATIASEQEKRGARDDPHAEAETFLRLIGQYRDELGDPTFLQGAKKISKLSADADAVFERHGVPVETRADLFVASLRLLSGLQSAARSDRPALATAGYADLVHHANLSATQAQEFAASKLGLFLQETQNTPP